MQLARRIYKEQAHLGTPVQTLKEPQVNPEDTHGDAGKERVQTLISPLVHTDVNVQWNALYHRSQVSTGGKLN